MRADGDVIKPPQPTTFSFQTSQFSDQLFRANGILINCVVFLDIQHIGLSVLSVLFDNGPSFKRLNIATWIRLFNLWFAVFFHSLQSDDIQLVNRFV